jgi:cytochrome c553
VSEGRVRVRHGVERTGCGIGIWAGAFMLLAPLSAPLAQIKGDREFGEYLSGTCVTCHQVSGKASGGVPPIVAWPEDQFVAVMNSYRAKDRENEVMRTIASPLTDEEIAALAAYFGSLPNKAEAR